MPTRKTLADYLAPYQDSAGNLYKIKREITTVETSAQLDGVLKVQVDRAYSLDDGTALFTGDAEDTFTTRTKPTMTLRRVTPRV